MHTFNKGPSLHVAVLHILYIETAVTSVPIVKLNSCKTAISDLELTKVPTIDEARI
jgi:hypothetical protein